MMKSHLACIALIVVFCSVKVLGTKGSTTTVKPKPAVKIVSATFTIVPSIKPTTPQSSSKSVPTPQSSSKITNNTITPNNTVGPLPTMSLNSTIFPNNTVLPAMNSTLIPNNTVGPLPTMSLNSTIFPNNTVLPAMNSTFNPNATIPVPSKTTQAPPHSSRHIPTKSTASPGKDDKDDDSMKKRMWIAAAFAILFGLTTLILVYLVYRQRKINRDLEGDPATSRLL